MQLIRAYLGPPLRENAVHRKSTSRPEITHSLLYYHIAVNLRDARKASRGFNRASGASEGYLRSLLADISYTNVALYMESVAPRPRKIALYSKREKFERREGWSGGGETHQAQRPHPHGGHSANTK